MLACGHGVNKAGVGAADVGRLLAACRSVADLALLGHSSLGTRERRAEPGRAFGRVLMYWGVCLRPWRYGDGGRGRDGGGRGRVEGARREFDNRRNAAVGRLGEGGVHGGDEVGLRPGLNP